VGAPIDARRRLAGALIDLGVEVFLEVGKSEDTARRMVGALRKQHGDGALHDALMALSNNGRVIAEPMSWIQAYLARRAAAPDGAPAPARASHAAPSAPRIRQIVTPESVGISPERAAKNRERNRQIAGPRPIDPDAVRTLGAVEDTTPEPP